MSKWILILGMAMAALAQAGTRALFDLSTPQRQPFPSDRFAIADRSHKTGLRVNLPLPDCAKRPSDCDDIGVLNTLDGFNIQPQLSVPFGSEIDSARVDSSTVFLIRLGSTKPGTGPAAALNQDGVTVITAAIPAQTGDVIPLFANGEGQTTSAVPLPKPVLPVTVPIGGKNARIPSGIPTGAAVPVE